MKNIGGGDAKILGDIKYKPPSPGICTRADRAPYQQRNSLEIAKIVYRVQDRLGWLSVMSLYYTFPCIYVEYSMVSCN